MKTQTLTTNTFYNHHEYYPNSPRILFALTVKTIFTHARCPIYAPRVLDFATERAQLPSFPNHARFFREPCMLFPKTKRPFFNNQARFSTPTPNLSTVSTNIALPTTSLPKGTPFSQSTKPIFSTRKNCKFDQSRSKC